MAWEKIQIQSNSIIGETSKAVLIKMPQKSRYKGYSFWHPSKCCREVAKNSYILQISFTDDFKFKLKKYGKGQHNFSQVLHELELSSEQLKDAFGFGVAELDDLLDDD